MLGTGGVTTTKNIPADKTAPPAESKEVPAAIAKGNPNAVQPAPGNAQPAPGAAQPAPSGKKAIGVKEVPPFEWKLLGTADGYTLTLFKSVEREDSDAQLVRVRKDGYYKDLRVVDIDMKIVQPKRLRPAKKPATKAKSTLKPAAKKSKAARKDSGPTILKMVVGKKSKKTKKTVKTKSASPRPVNKVVKKVVKTTAKKSSKTAVKKVKKSKAAAKKKTTKSAKSAKPTNPAKKKASKKK